MIKTDLRKLLTAAILGTALAVPTLLPADAMAQGRSDHRGRHDNGKHNGWDKHSKNDRRDDWRSRSHDWDRRNEAARERAERARHVAELKQREYLRAQQLRNRKRVDTSHRQSTKNQWRNLAYLGGAAGIYGLITGNKTVAALGLGGGLYSAYRYEQDRKSQSRDAQNRYRLFNRDSFDYKGHHYVRRTKKQNGQNYYYFQRSR